MTTPGIAGVEDHRRGGEPAASVVVVTHASPERLESCLASLRSQSRRDFEVVIADNGGSPEDRGDAWRRDLDVARVRLERNYGQIVARNVGSRFARTQLLYFLDDDTCVAPETLERLIAFFDEADVVAARSRMLYRTSTVYNFVVRHYDLGDEVVEGHAHENGFAIRREVYERYGGYDESFEAGNECLYWLHLLARDYGRARLVYFPGAVIYTDYARSLRHFVRKEWNYARDRQRMDSQRAEMMGFVRRHGLNHYMTARPHPRHDGAVGRGLRLAQRALRWLGERTDRSHERSPERP